VVEIQQIADISHDFALEQTKTTFWSRIPTAFKESHPALKSLNVGRMLSN
jgi:hypothetical protein